LRFLRAYYKRARIEETKRVKAVSGQKSLPASIIIFTGRLFFKPGNFTSYSFSIRIHHSIFFFLHIRQKEKACFLKERSFKKKK
jgi:hypothetical protein